MLYKNKFRIASEFSLEAYFIPFVVQYDIFLKGLLTPRDYGFFLSENHVMEEILKFFFGQ